MSERRVGTVSRGIRCPIFREGDDLAVAVVDSEFGEIGTTIKITIPFKK